MKKNLLCYFFLFALAEAGAQPTLTQANQAPSVGNIFVSYMADTSAQPGSAGANHTWTFTGLNITNTSIVQTFVTPASTPYAADFPAANLANSVQGSYEYYTSSSSSFILRGAYSGGGNTTFTSTCTEYTYPYTFNTSVSNPSVTGTFSGGTFTGNNSTLGDGYGNLVINGRTYSNVLRVKVIQSLDFNYTSLGHQITNTTTYYWYDAIHKNPLLEISTSDGSGVAPTHNKFVYVSDFATAINEISDNYLHFDVFPNPVKEKVYVQFENNFVSHGMISLYTNTGALVLQKKLEEMAPASHTEFLDLEKVSPGFYMLMINIGEAHTTRKIVVE